jgi:hypothetical protein
MDAGGLVKALLESVETGVFLTVAGVEGVGLGELVDFFWKNPRMDFWFLPDCEADGGGCFFCDARGVDISLPSTPRTILAGAKGYIRGAMVKPRGRDANDWYYSLRFRGRNDASRRSRARTMTKLMGLFDKDHRCKPLHLNHIPSQPCKKIPMLPPLIAKPVLEMFSGIGSFRHALTSFPSYGLCPAHVHTFRMADRQGMKKHILIHSGLQRV